MSPLKIFMVFIIILLLSSRQPIKELAAESSNFLNETKEENIFESEVENNNLIFKNAEKIEVFDSLSDDIKATYIDNSQITNFVEFFNSFHLEVSESFMDCQRPYEQLKIYYTDDTTDFISYGFTNLTHNDLFYTIVGDTDQKTKELDLLINQSKYKKENTTNIIKDYEYYSSKLSEMFEQQDLNFTEYFTVRGKLETSLKSENHFNANFLDESLQSYKLILYDEMNCSEYIFSTYEGLKFLMYTETTEPFISYNLNETSKRFLIENENMFIYDIDNKEILSDISKEDKQIIRNALDFENRILDSNFISHNWMDAYIDLIEHGYLPEHTIKIILTDIDFDGTPELFLTSGSITSGERNWIYHGFSYKDGTIIDIKCNMLVNLELYKDRESGELIWIASDVDYNFISSQIMEHSYTYYWCEVNFDDLANASVSRFFYWTEKYETNWREVEQISDSNFALLFENNVKQYTTKSKIEEIQKELFSKYELVEISQIEEDFYEFDRANVRETFNRDALYELLRTY